MGPKPEKSLIEKLSSYLVNPFKRKPPPKTPATLFDRLNNMRINNFRGLVGCIVPLCVLLPLWEAHNDVVKLQVMWAWMAWFFLLQPVAISNTSLIPIFFLPMAGIMNSVKTCGCYMNESIMMFVLGSWIIVLLNNSGVDRRIALWFLASGDATQYTGQKLVYKAGSAAFFLSMLSSRLIASLNLTEFITKACEKLDPSGKNKEVRQVRYVVNNAIQTSSGIGSVAIMHASWVTILFRGSFYEFTEANYEWPDVFNYFSYSAFAFPASFAMFIINIVYHTVLVGKVSKGLTENQTKEMLNIFKRHKAEVPKDFSVHELYTIGALVLLMALLLFRWVPILNFGWAEFSVKTESLPGVKDATVLAIFIIVLHILPKSFNFLKVFRVKKKSQLSMKPESAVLWWRFVDKNCNYGYLFTFGAAFSIIRASKEVHMDHELSSTMMDFLEMDFTVALLIIVLVSSTLCNIMSAMAACTACIPFVLSMSIDGPAMWPSKVYLAALAVGISSNFGFCIPFQYTPGYYCYRSGKVPIMTMIKYSFIPVVYCAIILFIFLAFVAEQIYDKAGAGFNPILPVEFTTLPPAEGEAGGDD